jgi:MerR family transcriptional regulator, redox-sensitive transcriptional activator SoxR
MSTTIRLEQILKSSNHGTLGTKIADAFVYTVSDVACQSGVAPSAVRFYDKHGIISGMRTGGNQRRFAADAACRVKVARVAQRIGYSVADIVELLKGLPRNPQLDDSQRLHITLTAEAHKRIVDIHSQLDALQSGAKLCELPDTRTLS